MVRIHRWFRTLKNDPYWWPHVGSLNHHENLPLALFGRNGLDTSLRIDTHWHSTRILKSLVIHPLGSFRKFSALVVSANKTIDVRPRHMAATKTSNLKRDQAHSAVQVCASLCKSLQESAHEVAWSLAPMLF